MSHHGELLFLVFWIILFCLFFPFLWMILTERIMRNFIRKTFVNEEAERRRQTSNADWFCFSPLRSCACKKRPTSDVWLRNIEHVSVLWRPTLQNLNLSNLSKKLNQERCFIHPAASVWRDWRGSKLTINPLIILLDESFCQQNVRKEEEVRQISQSWKWEN